MESSSFWVSSSVQHFFSHLEHKSSTIKGRPRSNFRCSRPGNRLARNYVEATQSLGTTITMRYNGLDRCFREALQLYCLRRNLETNSNFVAARHVTAASRRRYTHAIASHTLDLNSAENCIALMQVASSASCLIYIGRNLSVKACRKCHIPISPVFPTHDQDITSKFCRLSKQPQTLSLSLLTHSE